MVIYSHIAQQDLIETLYGLITWEKHKLTVEHCESYVDDMYINKILNNHIVV